MRLIRSTFVLFTLLLIVIGILLFFTRTANAVCLRYDNSNWSGSDQGEFWTFHPETNARFKHTTVPRDSRINIYVGVASEDQKHTMYLVGPKDGPYSLYIDPESLTGRGRGFTNDCSVENGCYVGLVVYQEDSTG